MATKARIISTLHIDGKEFQPNQVVAFDASAIKGLIAGGCIDPHSDAVAYCVVQLGAEVHRHTPLEDAAQAQAEATARAEAEAASVKAASKAQKNVAEQSPKAE